MVGHREDRELRRATLPRISTQPTELPNVLRPNPRAVVRFGLAAEQKIAVPDVRRSARGKPGEAICPGPRRHERLVQCLHEMEFRAAGAAEVAELGVIDAELVVDVVDQLGNEKIQIGVALSCRKSAC